MKLMVALNDKITDNDVWSIAFLREKKTPANRSQHVALLIYKKTQQHKSLLHTLTIANVGLCII